jgi:hypothetical protein
VKRGITGISPSPSYRGGRDGYDTNEETDMPLMRPRLTSAAPAALVLALVTAAGCGGGGASSYSPTASSTAPETSSTRPATTTTAPTSTGPGALQGEASAAATGDIPDNQVFLVFPNHAARYSMKYPEGWAQQGSGKAVTFRDKNNIVRITVATGKSPTRASVSRDVARLTKATVEQAPHAMTISRAPAYKVVYSTVSAPNPVTGKRVTLLVDRYYLSRGGRLAVVDLGTPRGVDNVDAYRLMIQSFRWS